MTIAEHNLRIDDLGELFHFRRVDHPVGAVVVFGGQAGSEGKGAIAGRLARQYEWGAAICTFMANAGHTWVGDDGSKVMVQQLPIGLVSPTVSELLIGPGAAISLERLEYEINEYDGQYDVSRRLRIHPRAMIIEEEHQQEEQQITKRVGSTMKGCGAALAAKVLRRPNVRLARDVAWLRPYIKDTTEIVNDTINRGSGVLVEGAQGFDLDINHGISYPHCTSRGTTPMQILADCGIDGHLVTRRIAVVRTFPIRVGHIEEDGQRVGDSGPFGSRELSWEQISARAGREVVETTTVTGRVRRVFEIDMDRLGYMSRVCRITDVALTFADYLSPDLYGVNDISALHTGELGRFIYDLERAVRRSTYNPRVTMVKTGPKDGHIIDIFRPWAI